MARGHHRFRNWLRPAALLLGLASVGCSLLVGVEPRKDRGTSEGESAVPSDASVPAPPEPNDAGQGSAGISDLDGGARSDVGETSLSVVDAAAFCAGATLCSGACVDLSNDAEHCGACDTVCANSQACEAAECVNACSAGLRNCNGSCVDVRFNATHCGACASSCASGEVCSLGQCAAPCDAGRCSPVTENCENGQDDDANALPDCADPSCTTDYHCVEDSVPGWTEPFVLVLGPGGGALECPEALSNVVVSGVHLGLIAAEQSCTCECTSSAQCLLSVEFFEDASCLGEPWTLSGEDALSSSACQALRLDRTGSEGAHSLWPVARLEASAAELTSCITTAQPPAMPQWEFDALGCAALRPNNAGCGAGICAPREPDAPYCVAQAGDRSCPSPFPEKTLLHTGFSDTRGCSECACELQCGAEFWGYSDENCSVAEQEFALNNNCGVLDADPTPLEEGATTWETRSIRIPEPSCAAHAEASGSAVVLGPVTVCCER